MTISKIFTLIVGCPSIATSIFFASASPVAAGALEALFAPKAEIWQTWTRHDPNGVEQVDHADWDRFLDNYVVESADGVNRVAYGRVRSEDRDGLSTYIDALSAIPIGGYSRKEQLAYWTNLYNALTVKVVLDNYPVTSIRDIDISPGIFADGPWGKKLVMVEGEKLSLNDIEHRILRPIWRDPRIHYAVNCASVGCPNLGKRAFTGANVEDALDTAAGNFINHPRAVQVVGGKLTVSSIYSWFQIDFGENEENVIDHLRQYALPDLLAELAAVDTIDDDTYDWNLNDQPPN